MSDQFRAEYQNVPPGYIETKDGFVPCPHTELFMVTPKAPVQCKGCRREWADLEAWEADTDRIITTVLGTCMGTAENNDIVEESEPLLVTGVTRHEAKKEERP